MELAFSPANLYPTTRYIVQLDLVYSVRGTGASVSLSSALLLMLLKEKICFILCLFENVVIDPRVFPV